MPKKSPKPIREYNCTQAELYAVARLGYDSCEENLAQFTLLKSIYTTQYITDQRQFITDAELLPDQQAREALAEGLRIDLENKADECLIKWQALKIYITTAFDEQHQKPVLEAAGYKLYGKAGKNNWEIVKNLLEAGSTFIDKNKTVLEANNNMPPVFQAEFDALKDEFITLYQTFKDAEQDAEEETTLKINANNALFNNLITVFKDGQHIFRHNAATRERFTFTKILELVSGTGGGGGEPGIITAITDQSVLNDVKLTLANIAMGDFEITWGDGGKVTLALDDTDEYMTHGYGSEGVYTIQIKGSLETLSHLSLKESRLTSVTIENLPHLTDLRLDDNIITGAVIKKTPEIEESNFQNNSMTEETVNRILIAYDNMGINDGNLYLQGGTNASPTGDGIIAKDNLTSRGVNVVVN